MNHSIESADRATHRKIVIAALAAAIVIAGAATANRVHSSIKIAATGAVIKAGAPIVLGDGGGSVAVR